MSATTFTLEQATALLPEITRRLSGTTQLLAHLDAIARRLTKLGYEPPGPLSSDPPSPSDAPPAVRAELERARLLREALREEVRAIEARGVVLRDLPRGLVDFRSIVDGERDVFLCWQLGERTISHFHELHSGHAGRRSIEGHRFFATRQLAPPRKTGS